MPQHAFEVFEIQIRILAEFAVRYPVHTEQKASVRILAVFQPFEAKWLLTPANHVGLAAFGILHLKRIRLQRWDKAVDSGCPRLPRAFPNLRGSAFDGNHVPPDGMGGGLQKLGRDGRAVRGKEKGPS